MQLASLFRNHGRFCASHPWEVIVATLTITVSTLSFSLNSNSIAEDLCRNGKSCESHQDKKTRGDVIVLTTTNCLVVVCWLYLQFRALRKLGSKYLLGVAGLFTLFASVVFTLSAIRLLKQDITGLNEALPFFLLLMDLSRARKLAKFALNAASKDEVIEKIGEGMATLGLTITLDTFVESLVIGVGTSTGVKELERMCCFGCISVIANYLIFMTFYPACLSLALEFSHGSSEYRRMWELNRSSIDSSSFKPNPVVQRVKLIMCAGLMLVHFRSRFFGGIDNDQGLSIQSIFSQESSIYEKWWQRVLGMRPEEVIFQYITVGVAVFLVLKYALWEKHDDTGSKLAKEFKKDCNKKEKIVTSNGTVTDAENHTEKLSANEKNTNESSPSVPLKAGREVVARKEENTKGEEAKPQFFIDTNSDEESDRDSKSEETADRKIQEREKTLEECLEILNNNEKSCDLLTDKDILRLVEAKHIAPYKLESVLNNPERGVSIRRQILSQKLTNVNALEKLPLSNYDYSLVIGACCENVIGYTAVPVGVAGPLFLDGKPYHVPMATTEGCLVASTNRGCRALTQCNGVRSAIYNDGMTRAPVVKFPSVGKACEAKLWLDEPDNFEAIRKAFNATSRFAQLVGIHCGLEGPLLFIRFKSRTGDAMGMNMISKGTDAALRCLEDAFPEMDIISLSGNYCTDKKPAAINWIEGRGKSVVCEAEITARVIKEVLKTTPEDLIEVNYDKNLIGSAMAASIGGFNAHAANIVTAIYIATGQDPAQNVESSNCITTMEKHGENVRMYCTMPCIEVGTVGGGTILGPQSACLEMLGIRGANVSSPGENARQLARIVCATVMAGELSLLSALAAGHLVRSHMKYNR
ncbi:uncharacterized protein TRIADDRAFT_37359 [Trichoplax adhaerens]|uniref:3-hydroxy-3-methylglutaryl coenzyme A reductase n=1 Tax=Trichoplax adhaerens TaxID=10228 RepID=B3RS07_TRIAD|nr:hypothetical protein TRIADDRAFT_37359 [Trichoplax adhaerens]EDV26440.1 hypothetical protein TRIADDRAFT_37359 [Trichoplax adhaerens]|eukprot:XP_002110436.1 hypothetical protein TRIADDRAFT_37359 [Trichoplax adhaerens]